MKNAKTKGLSSLTNGVVDPLLNSLNSDLTKRVVDTLDKVLKDIPYLKAVLILIKTPRSITDGIFTYKFNKCFEASGLNKDGLEKLNKKLTGKKRVRFWKLIFTSIQSHDDEKKSELVGKVVTAFAVGNISYDEMIRMIHASNSVSVDNLEYLKDCYLGNPGTMPPYARQEFATLGLLGIDSVPLAWAGNTGVSYPLTDFGGRYVGAIFDYPLYPMGQNLKIGMERLVGTVKSPGSSERTVLPLQEAIDKGYWYGEAALVLHDNDKLWISNQNPVVASSIIYAGEYGEKALANVTDMDERNFAQFHLSTDDARHVTVTYYTLKEGPNGQLAKRHSGAWVKCESLISDGSAPLLQGIADALVKRDLYERSLKDQQGGHRGIGE